MLNMGNRAKPATTRTVNVSKSQFERDPGKYVRKASAGCRVIVRHDVSKRVSMEFGGRLDHPSSFEESSSAT